jgi:hypothetical protein
MPFDTSLLDAALARRQARDEAERQHVVTQVLQLLDDLGPRYNIQRAYLFGSVVKPGRFKADSDVDIAVEQIDPRQFIEALSEFSMSLNRDVDLIELDKCHFADKIRREGVVWTAPA